MQSVAYAAWWVSSNVGLVDKCLEVHRQGILKGEVSLYHW